MMNDFLYTTDPGHKDAMENYLRRHCDASCTVVSDAGDWGSFVCIARPSTPHAIINNDRHIVMLIGNPSFQGRYVASRKGDLDRTAISRLVEDAFRTEQAFRWHDHFNGQFAITAVHKSTGMVLMASDMLQFITTYYTSGRSSSGPWFVCGSQINHVADISGRHAIDPVSIAECMLYKTPTSPHTFLQDIYTVPPASVLYRRPGGDVAIQRYWTPQEPDTVDFTIQECGHELRRIAESNLEQVAQDYDSIAILLSGGSDSRAVAGILRSKPNIEALTFSESENRETGLARRIAEIANMPFRLFFHNSDYYLDHMDACSELAGVDQFFIHSHLLNVWQTMGLHEKDVVLGGFFADGLLKGNQLPHKPVIPGCGLDKVDTSQLAPRRNAALSPELQEAAHARRQAHLDAIKEFRPTTYKQFEMTFPLSMNDALCYTALNRRLFNGHELFSDNRIVELACRVPYEWKLNDHLFLHAFKDIFRLFKSVPHTTGKRCNLNPYVNMPFCLATTVRKKIQLQINKRTGSTKNVDPWRQSPNIVREAARRGYFDAYLMSDVFREAVGDGIDLQAVPTATKPKPLLFVLQVARYMTTHESPHVG